MIITLRLGSSNLHTVLGETVVFWHRGLRTFLNKPAYLVPHFLLPSPLWLGPPLTYSVFRPFPAQTWKSSVWSLPHHQHHVTPVICSSDIL